MDQRTCVVCSNALTGRQTKYCGKPCYLKVMVQTDAYKRAQANRAQVHRKKYLVECAACGAEIEKNNRKRRAVCSMMCRYYVQYGRWQASTVPQPKPEKIPEPKTCTVWYGDCAWCGSTFSSSQPHKRWCNQRCSRSAERRARKAREHGASGTYTWTQVMALFVASDRRCSYCDVVVDVQPDPDHVIPLSRGGSNSISNIVPCCRLCNADKCDHSLDEWKQSRERRGLSPRRYELTGPRFKHLALSRCTPRMQSAA